MESALTFWFKQTVMTLLAVGWLYNQVNMLVHRFKAPDDIIPVTNLTWCPTPPVSPPVCDDEQRSFPCVLAGPSAPISIPVCSTPPPCAAKVEVTPPSVGKVTDSTPAPPEILLEPSPPPCGYTCQELKVNISSWNPLRIHWWEFLFRCLQTWIISEYFLIFL